MPTFQKAQETVLNIHKENWKPGGKSEQQWRASMRDYILPTLGKRLVSEITAPDVLQVLVPIWNVKRTTAKRCRQRISTVLKWAIAKNLRVDDPTSAVTAALPKNGIKRQHLPALPYADVGRMLEIIRITYNSEPVKLAFNFLVFTAARSGEVRKATWQEINLKAGTWTIPGERMKAGLEHRVPLSRQAIEVLHRAHELAGGKGFVFQTTHKRKPGRALSDRTLSKMFREHEIGAVPHGFRSSFRDWAAELSTQPREICEFALAHIEGTASELAYRRTDYFEKRRKLMQDWADYIFS